MQRLGRVSAVVGGARSARAALAGRGPGGLAGATSTERCPTAEGLAWPMRRAHDDPPRLVSRDPKRARPADASAAHRCGTRCRPARHLRACVRNLHSLTPSPTSAQWPESAPVGRLARSSSPPPGVAWLRPRRYARGCRPSPTATEEQARRPHGLCAVAAAAHRTTAPPILFSPHGPSLCPTNPRPT